MREFREYGFLREALGNGRPNRDPDLIPVEAKSIRWEMVTSFLISAATTRLH